MCADTEDMVLTAREELGIVRQELERLELSRVNFPRRTEARYQELCEREIHLTQVVGRADARQTIQA